MVLRRTETKKEEGEEGGEGGDGGEGVSFLVQMSLNTSQKDVGYSVLRKTMVISSDTDVLTLLKVFFTS